MSSDLVWDIEAQTLKFNCGKLVIQSNTSEFNGEFIGPYAVLKVSRGTTDSPESIRSGDFLGGLESVSFTGKHWAWGGVAGFKQDNQFPIDETSNIVPTEFVITVSNGVSTNILTQSLVFQSNGFLTVPGGFHCQGKTQTEIDELSKNEYPLSPAGTIVFNSTTKKHQAFDGTSWHNLY